MLPRESLILELDRKTGISAAKEVLRGRAYFHGDVPDAPAALLSIGTLQDLGGYCRMLIWRVGDDRGLILGNGYSVPCDVKPENFGAMLEAGKNVRG